MKPPPLRIPRSTFATMAVLVFSVASIHAHPGHGLHEAGASHILGSPYHLAILGFAGAVLLLAGRFVQRRLPRQALQAAGIASLAAATLLWGLHI